MFFIYNKALFIVLQIILREKIKGSGAPCLPIFEKITFKIHKVESGKFDSGQGKFRELPGNLASLKLWTP